MKNDDIIALRAVLLDGLTDYSVPFVSFVGSDSNVKLKWGQDICALDVNLKLKDIVHFPHLFVLACLMQGCSQPQIAWAIPYMICRRLCNGHFDFQSLSKVRQSELIDWFSNIKKDVWGDSVADLFYAAVQKIHNDYDDNASLIWNDSSLGSNRPSSSEVILNFLQFHGCRIEDAMKAASILHRYFGVEYSDYSSLDIVLDIPVRKVFFRLGMVDRWDDNDSIIYRARMLNPEYPGIIGYACEKIDRDYCTPMSHPNKPDCETCPLRNYCHFNDSVVMLNDMLKLSSVVKIERWSFTDVRPLIHGSKDLAYIDLCKPNSYQRLLDYLLSPHQRILCIDNMEKMVMSDRNFSVSQLLYSLIKREEYVGHKLQIDFSRYSAVLIFDGKNKNDNYEFFDIRGGIQLIM